MVRELPKPRESETPVKVQEAYRAVDRCLNTFDSEPANQLAWLLAANHRTLVQNTMRDLVLPFLQHLAEMHEEGRYDARDEGAVKIAAALWAQAQDLQIGMPTI